MKTDESRARNNIVILFAILMAGIVLLLLLTADLFDRSYRQRILAFSDGWMDEEGAAHNIEDITAGEMKMGMFLTKTLPEHLTDADCLCFESRNCNLNVWVEGSKLYSFKGRENLSGMGYGRAFHEVNLRAAYSGMRLRIEMSGLYEGHRGGNLTGLYVAAAPDYVHLQVEERLPSAILSTLILFFGIIMILIFIWIPDKDRLPFDIASLGLAAFAIGVWHFADTSILPLLTGQLYAWRGIERIMLFLVGFPIISFVNSLTARKRVIYQKIWFAATIAFVGLIIGCRYFLDIDMIDSFTVFFAIYIAGLLVTFACIFIDNAIYCRREHITMKMKYFFFGICVLAACAVVDLAVYFASSSVLDSYGTFTRIGTVAFITIMMLQFLSWWTKDQATIGRERFVNRVLQDTIASKNSEDSIRSVLEYIGTELKAGRVMVFEEGTQGRFHGTYEWCAEGRDPGALDLLYLPYQGFLDKVYERYRADGKSLVIEDVEAHRENLSALDELLRNNHVSNLAACPLEINGKMAGAFALVDMPKQNLPDAAEIIGSISYFLDQLILRRDEEKRLRYYSYNDTLSGALNRRAYQEYIEQDMDMSAPFGYLICEIAGLKAANSMQGYEAGDRMVQTVVDILGEIFGKGAVYRVGGSQFVAFGAESDETFFDNDVDRFRKKTTQNGIHVYAGAVYCIYGTRDLKTVIRRASECMNEEKAKARGGA